MVAFSNHSYWEFYFNGNVAYSQFIPCSVTTYALINTSTLIYTCLYNNAFSLFALNRFLRQFSRFGDLSLPHINQLVFEPITNTLYVFGENEVLQSDMNEALFSGQTFSMSGYSNIQIHSAVSIGNVNGLTGIILAGDAIIISTKQKRAVMFSFDENLNVRAAMTLAMTPPAAQQSIFGMTMLPCEPGFYGCGNIAIVGEAAGRAFLNFVYSPYLNAVNVGFYATETSVLHEVLSIGDSLFAIGSMNDDVLLVKELANQFSNQRIHFNVPIQNNFLNTINDTLLVQSVTNYNQSLFFLANQTLSIINAFNENVSSETTSFSRLSALLLQSQSLALVAWMQTVSPTVSPTIALTLLPSKKPSQIPTPRPSRVPLVAPTLKPILLGAPTEFPVVIITEIPSEVPTQEPSEAPTENPTTSPTLVPTLLATVIETAMTYLPTTTPTRSPVQSPTPAPQVINTRRPFAVPTLFPTVNVTEADTKITQVTCQNITEQVFNFTKQAFQNITEVRCNNATSSSHTKNNTLHLPGPEWAQWTVGVISVFILIAGCVLYPQESRDYLFSCYQSKNSKKKNSQDKHLLGTYDLADKIFWDFEDSVEQLSDVELGKFDFEEEKDSEDLSEVEKASTMSDSQDEVLEKEKSDVAFNYSMSLWAVKSCSESSSESCSNDSDSCSESSFSSSASIKKY